MTVQLQWWPLRLHMHECGRTGHCRSGKSAPLVGVVSSDSNTECIAASCRNRSSKQCTMLRCLCPLEACSSNRCRRRPRKVLWQRGLQVATFGPGFQQLANTSCIRCQVLPCRSQVCAAEGQIRVKIGMETPLSNLLKAYVLSSNLSLGLG